jgi:hypothetical protein
VNVFFKFLRVVHVFKLLFSPYGFKETVTRVFISVSILTKKTFITSAQFLIEVTIKFIFHKSFGNLLF